MAVHKTQQGFTLVELVIVIVILGILAAAAVPRFINMQQQARVSAVNGLAGGIRSASNLAHSYAIATNVTGATGTIASGDGVTLDMVYSYLAGTATGVNAAIQDLSGFTASNAGGVATFTHDGAPTPATCSVTYTAPAAANTAPTVVVNTTTC